MEAKELKYGTQNLNLKKLAIKNINFLANILVYSAKEMYSKFRQANCNFASSYQTVPFLPKYDV
jgi:hypothetical protein